MKKKNSTGLSVGLQNSDCSPLTSRRLCVLVHILNLKNHTVIIGYVFIIQSKFVFFLFVGRPEVFSLIDLKYSTQISTQIFYLSLSIPDSSYLLQKV